MRFLLPFLLAAPALAQEAAPPPGPDAPDRRTFQVPAGCEAYLTIQSADCSVSHHFTCEGDPAGVQRRVDMDEGGVTYAGAIDAETQWLESHQFLSEHSERLAPSNPDPASATELFETGVDTWDFTTLSDEIGPTRYVGQDRLTGETAEIDGVTLDRTEYEIAAYDPAGKVIWRGTGSEYISRDWRMFISGMSSTVVDGEVTDANGTPVEFIEPGEPGFLSASPKHGCGLVVSGLPSGLSAGGAG